jgi:hypothetical protein
MKFDVKIQDDSVRRTINDLAKINRELQSDLEALIIDIAQRIVRDTKQPSFPVITGTLKGSYQTDDRIDKSEMSIEVGSEIEYAPNVEERKPFFEAATEKNADLFDKSIEKLIEKHT